MAGPVETEKLAPVEAHETEFLVSYDLSGYLLILAPDAAEASRRANQLLRALIVKVATQQGTAAQASELRLDDLAVTIDGVESLEFLMDEAHLPDRQEPALSAPADHDGRFPDAP